MVRYRNTLDAGSRVPKRILNKYPGVNILSSFNEMVSNAVLGFILALFAGLATTIGGAAPYFSKLNDNRFLAGALASSAGVMLYVSFVDIYTVSVESFGEFFHNQGKDTKYGSVLATVFFFVGIIFSVFLDAIVHKLAPHMHDEVETPDGNRVSLSKGNPHQQLHDAVEFSVRASDAESKKKEDEIEISFNVDDSRKPEQRLSVVVSKEDKAKLFRVAVISGIALGLHNFPEGLATFVAALADPKLGIGLALAIALHNIPEGVIVAIPIYYSTGNRQRAFFYSFISGISEPIGALFGWLALSGDPSPFAFGAIFALVSGIMVFLALTELLPEAYKYDRSGKVANTSLLLGMAVMALSLELFNL